MTALHRFAVVSRRLRGLAAKTGEPGPSAPSPISASSGANLDIASGGAGGAPDHGRARAGGDEHVREQPGATLNKGKAAGAAGALVPTASASLPDARPAQDQPLSAQPVPSPSAPAAKEADGTAQDKSDPAAAQHANSQETTEAPVCELPVSIEAAGGPASIIFDLVGARIANAFGAWSVAFDLDGDGTSEQLNWLNPGFAFLALDRNGDGKIGSGLEISFTQDAAGATTELEGLAAFDSNSDGTLSAQDLRFGDFLVWRDANADGISQAGELQTLTQAGISSIGLTLTPTGDDVVGTTGNVVLNTGTFRFATGGTGTFGDAVLRTAGGESAEDLGQPALRFARKAGKYRLNVNGGVMSVVPAKPRGMLDPGAGVFEPGTMLVFKNRQFGMLAPIVLDLDGDGVELVSSKKARAGFDMNGDGSADDTGWAGGGDGFLVIDRNRDGRISGPSELSFLSEKADAKNGLAGLSVLDSDRNGKIDAADLRFRELSIWSDANGNGVTDAGELRSLADLGIVSLGLLSTANQQTAKIGDNVILSTATFTRADGSTGTLADAALAYKPGPQWPSRWRDLLSGHDFGFRDDGIFALPRIVDSIDPTDPPDLGALPGLLDRRAALMAQHMAAFGVTSGEAEWQLRERPNQPIFDYFA